jgi:hypothetical protein
VIVAYNVAVFNAAPVNICYVYVRAVVNGQPQFHTLWNAALIGPSSGGQTVAVTNVPAGANVPVSIEVYNVHGCAISLVASNDFGSTMTVAVHRR